MALFGAFSAGFRLALLAFLMAGARLLAYSSTRQCGGLQWPFGPRGDTLEFGYEGAVRSNMSA